ncbi:TetR/AcrR family transcriptional regulator [Nocardia sp. KC 131]|uniref:TetR/AcrR family transcriptional regulator n=1 Tax=Nocardia arseniciresistens TaxID=3392119 RepID=UPI00398EBEE5
MTSTKMVEAMLTLIQSRGYAGTGINSVIDHAKVPKGSLYFHFPEGKEQLGEHAIGVATEQFRQLVTEAMASAPTPGAGLHRVVDVLGELLVDSDFQLGCPVSVVTLEMGGHSDRLRNACADAYESWIAAVSEYLSSRGHPEPQARALAVTAVSAVEGAMIVARAMRDTQPLVSTAQAIGSLLDGVALETGSVR